LPKADRHDSFIVREGLLFAVPLFLATLTAFWAGIPWLAWPLLFVTLFVAWFFRNPERQAPDNPRQIISPADGKVIRIEEAISELQPGQPSLKISIFMNIFNVHVNRSPCPGQIVSIRYREGKFLSANLDKASALNERNTLLIHR